MKKVIIAAAICVFSTGAFAMGTLPTENTVLTTQISANQAKDGYLMKEGVMYVVKNGEASEMTEDVTLENGTVITKDGKVTPKDGETVTLQDGQYVDLEGNIKNWEEEAR